MTPVKAALHYLEHYGYSIIPLNPSADEDKGKKPLVPWLDYQKRKPTREEVELWWSKWPEAMIGVVCGPISGVMALDADSDEAKQKLESLLPDTFQTAIVKSPRGWHYWFSYKEGARNNNNGLIHVRAEGGYIAAPPSKRENGNCYSWVVPLKDASPAMLPGSLAHIINNSLYTGESQQLSKNSQESQLSQESQPKFFEHLRRDEDLFHAAWSLAKGGANEDFTTQVIERLTQTCNNVNGHPLEKDIVKLKVKSAFDRLGRKERNISRIVRDWVLVTDGDFSVTLLYQSVTVVTSEEKATARKTLQRMKEEGIIEKYGNKDGIYRRICKEVDEIKFWEKDDETEFPIILPFGLSKLCRLLPGAVVMVAGSKSAGKTAFMLNLIKDNMGSHGFGKEDIIYMTSELSKPEVRNRLMDFRGIDINYWKFKAIRKTSDWQDLVTSERKIFIIDYLDITKEFHDIGEPIKRISDKLRDGIAIIGIQKPPGRDEGLGGARTLDKARLYLAMDQERIKIVDVKAPKEMNVRGLVRRFIFEDRGTVFKPKTEWITEEEERRVFR